MTERVDTSQHTHQGSLSELLQSFGPAIAIDSSLGTSVAVSHGSVMTVAAEDDPLAHAEVIGALIERALTDANLAARDVANVIIGIGPGPFTGLRVGIAAAHGFAAGIGAEPLGVISHDAVAYDYFQEHPDRHEVVVLTDARRKELFTTRYLAPGDARLPIRKLGPELKPVQEFTVEFTGEFNGQQHPDTGLFVRPTRISSASLMEIAALRHAASQPFEPPQALYLRSPDVTLPSNPKRVSS